MMIHEGCMSFKLHGNIVKILGVDQENHKMQFDENKTSESSLAHRGEGKKGNG